MAEAYHPSNRRAKGIGKGDLSLCTAYLYRKDGCTKGEACDNLHVCRNYILKKCKSGNQCRFLHDLQSNQTRAMFQRRFGIYPLEGETLRTFKEVFAATLRTPQVDDESLDDKESREQIERMKRQNLLALKRFLKSFRDSPAVPSSEQAVPRESKPWVAKASTVTSPKPPPSTSDDPHIPVEKDPAICAFFLKGHCKFTGEMHLHPNYVHCSTPFQWQIRSGNGHWSDITEIFNHAIERDFCDVRYNQYTAMITTAQSCRSVTIKFSADSLTVTDNQNAGDTLDVRRLSTVPSVSAKSWQKTSSTHWIWYHQNKGKEWLKFFDEASEETDDSKSVCSTLEKSYLDFKNKGSPCRLFLQPKNWTSLWEIDFSQMTWSTTADRHRNPLPIARRPKPHLPNIGSDPVVRPKSTHVLPGARQELPSAVASPSRPVSLMDIAPPIPPTMAPPNFPAKAPPIPPAKAPPIPPAKAPPNPSQKECLFICPYFLRGKCKFDEDKYHHKRHFPTPYQWQFMDETSRGGEWLNFTQDENDTVERAFCDVTNSLCKSKLQSTLDNDHTIYFSGDPVMSTSAGFKIRRLSTSTSVLITSWETAFCMEWVWYWCDEMGRWNLYADQSDKGTQSSIDSATIEKQFLDYERNHSESTMEFTAGNQMYKLDFAAMHQTNVRYDTCRKIRRRPTFVPMAERRKLSRERSDAQRLGVVAPSTWDSRGVPSDVKLIPLNDATSLEYSSVARLFSATMNAKGTVISIERIQNMDLWEDFTKMKDRMKKKNGGRPVAERQLFHGTNLREEAEAICRQNFDWRLSGSNVGAVHGKGSYFARDASFAHSYTKADPLNHRYVLVAQVLIGNFVKGDPSDTRPPPKDPAMPYGDLYDSCVDNKCDPTIFVIFDKNQVYPEYLIKYKEKSSIASATGRSSSGQPSSGPSQSSQYTYNANTGSCAYSSSSNSTSTGKPTPRSPPTTGSAYGGNPYSTSSAPPPPRSPPPQATAGYAYVGNPHSASWARSRPQSSQPKNASSCTIQ